MNVEPEREHRGHRLERALEQQGKTQVSLATFCGVTPQAVAKWIKSGKIGRDNLEKAAEFLNCSVVWLNTGKGDPGTFLPEPLMVGEWGGPTDYSTHREAPVLSWEQAATWASHISQPGLPRRQVPLSASRNAFWLLNNGDSMKNPHGSPSVPPDAYILVDPDRKAKNGKLVVAGLRGTPDLTFKKLVYDAGRTYLFPLNPRYEPVAVNGDLMLIGLVTKFEMDL